MDTVRSSVMRRLGLSTTGPIDRNDRFAQTAGAAGDQCDLAVDASHAVF